MAEILVLSPMAAEALPILRPAPRLQLSAVLKFDGPLADLAPLLNTAAQIMEPPPDMNAGEWAEAYRVLSAEVSAEAGAFRVSRTPYMWPIYEAAARHHVRLITIVMGTQMGKTEGLFNIIGHGLDHNPVPTMFVAPTKKLVEEASELRVKDMLRSSESLWAKLAKGRHDKIARKNVAGTPFYFGWAGSPTEASSKPVGLALVDERDRCPPLSEGDIIDLILARTPTFPNALVVAPSSPTIEGASPIWTRWQEGTRHVWHWPCVHCGELFAPLLRWLQWPKDAPLDEIRDAARLVCPTCGGEMSDGDRGNLNRAGLMRRVVWDSDTGTILKMLPEPEGEPWHYSFWVHGLCSPWRRFSEVAMELAGAYRSGDPDRIQAVVNTRGGEAWRIEGEAPSLSDVDQHRQPWEVTELPSGVQMITAGVDVQKMGLWYLIAGWGFNSECWILDAGYIHGDTSQDSVWLLWARRQGQLFGGVGIDRVFIDSGFLPHQVYSFARRHPGHAFPCKGWESRDVPVRSSAVDVNAAGGKIKGGVLLWHVSGDHYKTQIHSKIRWPMGEPGGLHIRQGIPPDLGPQLLAETLLIKASGRRTWLRKNKDNHLLDCFQYAWAGADSLQLPALQPLDSRPEGNLEVYEDEDPEEAWTDNWRGARF